MTYHVKNCVIGPNYFFSELIKLLAQIWLDRISLKIGKSDQSYKLHEDIYYLL